MFTCRPYPATLRNLLSSIIPCQQNSRYRPSGLRRLISESRLQPPNTSRNMWNPTLYSKNASFVYELGGPVINLLQPAPGERILDLGCGSGELTKALADVGCELVGIDASQDMINVAKEKGLNAYVMDAHKLTFDNEFDSVFSNAALHWMSKDPQEVVKGVVRSLKTKGRFVGEFGGKGNVKAIYAALKMVLERRGISTENRFCWYFPSVEEYSSLLESAGLTVEEMELFKRDTPVPTGPSGWLKVFGDKLVADLSENDQQQIFHETEQAMEPLHVNEEGVYLADYVRLRFRARKKS